MEATSYILLGQSEVERVRQVVTDTFVSWCDAWLPETPAYAIFAQPAPTLNDPEQTSSERWFSLKDEECGIYWVSQLSAEEWYSLLFGQSLELVHSGEQVTPITHSVVDQAVEELFRSIFSAFGLLDQSVDAKFDINQSIPRDQFKFGSAAVVVDIGLLQNGMRIVINHAMAERLLRVSPARNSNSPRVTLPRRIVNNQLVEVEAWIGEAQIDIATLHSLNVGDIIPLSRDIDQPIALRMSDGQPLCKGFLGSSDDRRALEICI